MAKIKKTSLVMSMYQQFKNKYSDCILLFRIGDCYESFFYDAELCSYVCDLPLEHRERSGDVIPVVSIPFWEFSKHKRKILSAGCRVTTCEKIGDRQFTRTITPGTVNA